MNLLAIDPGPEESALLILDTKTNRVVWWEKAPNEAQLKWVAERRIDYLAVEMVASYGMPVGAEVFNTCVWVGRFIERYLATPARKGTWGLVYRRDVKLHLCDSARAKDSNVRQALLDAYGGKEHALGRKASPGPLYGLSGDAWAALGVALTAKEAA